MAITSILEMREPRLREVKSLPKWTWEFRATEGSGLACLLCMWSCSELEGVVLCMGGDSPVLNLLAWAGSMKQGSEGG